MIVLAARLCLSFSCVHEICSLHCSLHVVIPCAAFLGLFSSQCLTCMQVFSSWFEAARLMLWKCGRYLCTLLGISCKVLNTMPPLPSYTLTRQYPSPPTHRYADPACFAHGDPGPEPFRLLNKSLSIWCRAFTAVSSQGSQSSSGLSGGMAWAFQDPEQGSTTSASGAPTTTFVNPEYQPVTNRSHVSHSLRQRYLEVWMYVHGTHTCTSG